MNQEIFELSDKVLEARAGKKHIEMALKQAAELCEQLEAELIASMLDTETQSFKRNDVQFCLCSKAYISADAERKDELWAAMKREGYDALFTINPMTLQGEIKRMTEENNGELPNWLNGLIKQYEKPYIQIRNK